MKYLSVCSGIEAATVAWHHMGWSPVGFAEIEKFPAQLLAHHYPGTPNFGDLTKHESWNIESGTVDLLVGGTPCQAFSVAGLRRGMDDERGQLTLEFVRLAARLRPRWIVWENVPGVLSSAGGRDFGSFLGALGELGYGWAYRILDAQYFGVAQRRRRVFVVGYLGDWRNAAAVLLERESMRRDSAPRREARQAVANCLGASPASSSCPNVGNGQGNVIGTLTARMGHNPMGLPELDGGMYMPWPMQKAVGAEVVASLVSSGRGVSRTGESRGQDPIVAETWPAEVAPTLDACFASKHGQNNQHALGGAGLFVPASPIAFHNRQDPDVSGDMTHPLGAKDNGLGVAMAVPIELRNAKRDPEKHDAVNRQGVGVAKNGDPAHTVTSACVHGVAMAFHENQRAEVTLNDTAGSLKVAGGKPGQGYPAVLAPTLTATNDPSRSPQSSEITAQVAAVTATTMQVRRLTPIECERLQGFPDGYTDIRPRDKDTPDGPRYKALGNSMAVPVMRWIGERIEAVDKLSR